MHHLIVDSLLVRLLFAAGVGFWSWKLADDRHRSTIGWPLLGAVAGYGLEAFALLVPLALSRLAKLDLKQHYLELRAHEQIAKFLGGPSLVGDNLDDRILMVLANNPEGLYLNALAQGVGQSWRAIEGPVGELVKRRKVFVRDELYFIDSTESALVKEA